MPRNVDSSPRQPPATGGVDRCDLDVYSLFGDSRGSPVVATTAHMQQPVATQESRLQRISVARPEPRHFPVDRQTRGSAAMLNDGRRVRLVSEESDAPFSGGFCRQLAAMYTDVGMTTVERLRWLCGWMILVYALTCCAWFAWPAYTVTVVGVLTGTVGMLACQRPHDRSYLTYVLTFLALNYGQLVLLVWLVFVTLPAELTKTCSGNCSGEETKAVFMLLLVLATAVFHWRVATITRHYVREFRMVEQLVTRGSQAYFFDTSYSRGAASSTMATDIQSMSTTSDVSVSVITEQQHIANGVPYLSDSSEVTRV
ncbi:unnamed protein product [Phytophthora lilii]|uniref:Unnamed protein product n=1 Tax=Phytophthora lilii TaxID=2077276 RepID=A0A9W7CNH4_9STRA|nr:unnamed protein product [Phytophthora lilii]